MKKILFLILICLLFSLSSFSAFAASSEGGSFEGGGGTGDRPSSNNGIYKFDGYYHFDSYIENPPTTTLTLPIKFYSSAPDSPLYTQIKFGTDGTIQFLESAYSGIQVYSNGKFSHNIYRYIKVVDSPSISDASANYFASVTRVLSNFYDYNGFFATNMTDYYQLQKNHQSDFVHFYLLYNSSTKSAYFYVSETPFYVDTSTSNLVWYADGAIYYYSMNATHTLDPNFFLPSSHKKGEVFDTLDKLLWHNVPLYDENGNKVAMADENMYYPGSSGGIIGGDDYFDGDLTTPDTDDSGGWFESIFNGLDSIYDSIVNLPSTILNGIKSIFIPDTNSIKNKFTGFVDELEMKFNIDTSFFEYALGNEQPVTDIKSEYYISGVGNFNLTFFDSKYFIDGVQYFRGFIRGFIVLLLCIFNVRMALSFIRQDAGVATGKAVKMSNRGDE